MRNLTLILVFILAAFNLFGQGTYNSTGSNTDWANNAAWGCTGSCNGFPGTTGNTSDIAQLDETMIIGINSSFTISQLQITSASSNALTISSGSSLTITSNLTIGGGGGFTFTFNGGTLTINDSDWSVSGNNLTASGNNQPIISGNGTLNVNGVAYSINSGSLPVELTYFKAEPSAETVNLSWSTASELNFDYFTIEKSTNGKEFYEIARIAGHGTTTVKHDYRFSDEKPVVGRSYYRLIETDLDKSITHLKTITADFTGTKNLKLYPNPAVNGEVTMELNFVPTQDVAVSILDLRGVTINEFALGKQSLTLPLQVAAGVYLVVMRGSNFKSVNRLIVR